MESPDYNKQGYSASAVLDSVFMVVSDPINWFHCSVNTRVRLESVLGVIQTLCLMAEKAVPLTAKPSGVFSTAHLIATSFGSKMYTQMYAKFLSVAT